MADNSCSGAWEYTRALKNTDSVPVGAARLWKCSKMRPSSGSAPRSVSGAWPPGIKTPAKLASSSSEIERNGLGELRLFSSSIFLMSSFSLFFSHHAPRKASGVLVDSGSTLGRFPAGDANYKRLVRTRRVAAVGTAWTVNH